MRSRGRDGVTFTHFCVFECVIFSAINCFFFEGVLSIVGLQHFSSGLGELQVYSWCHALQRVPNLSHKNGCIFRGFLLILLPSCGILEMRQCYGVWQVPKDSVADGHNCFAHGCWLWLLENPFCNFFGPIGVYESSRLLSS
jgi:hypothetical protein